MLGLHCDVTTCKTCVKGWTAGKGPELKTRRGNKKSASVNVTVLYNDMLTFLLIFVIILVSILVLI